MMPIWGKIERIYIAAPFTQRARASDVRRILKAQSIESTSTWIDKHLADGPTDEASLAREAEQDCEDIDRSSALLLLNGEEYRRESTGGMSVELGYALAKDKLVFVLGGASNVFHHHAAVVRIAELSEIWRLI